MARQKLGEDKRYKQIGVKITPDLYKAIKAQANHEGLTISTFVNNVLLLYFIKACDIE